MLIREFSQQFIYLFTLRCSVNIGVHTEPPSFFMKTNNILTMLNVFLRFAAAKCSEHVFIFHETFVPVNGENY